MNTWTGIGLSLCIVTLAILTAGIWHTDGHGLAAWLLKSIAISYCAVPFILAGAFLSRGIDRLGIDRLFIVWFLHVCAGFGLGVIALMVFRLNQSLLATLFVTCTGVATVVAFRTGMRHVNRLFWMRFFGIGVPAGYALVVAVAGLM